MRNTPNPLAAAKARVSARADVIRAAKNPHKAVPIRITAGKPRTSLHQRCAEYRRGHFPYGLAMPAEFVEQVQIGEYRGKPAAAVALRPGAPIPEMTDADRRAAALVAAHRTGTGQWPTEITETNRLTTNQRLRQARLYIERGGTIRRITKDEEF